MKNEELLKMNDTTQDTLVIIREFNASIELVFDILTSHEHIMNWYSPASMDVSHSRGNLAVGEEYSIGMKRKGSDGPIMELVGKFLEVDPPFKVVYTQSYMMPDGASPETKITIELSKLDDNNTQMVFIHSGFADAKSRDQALKSGWTAAMEKIENIVKSLS